MTLGAQQHAELAACQIRAAAARRAESARRRHDDQIAGAHVRWHGNRVGHHPSLQVRVLCVLFLEGYQDVFSYYLLLECVLLLEFLRPLECVLLLSLTRMCSLTRIPSLTRMCSLAITTADPRRRNPPRARRPLALRFVLAARWAATEHACFAQGAKAATCVMI